jgi:hypothetical protein
MILLNKTSYLNEEVNHTDPSLQLVFHGDTPAGAYIIKKFTTVIFASPYKARLFANASHFCPSLMFWGVPLVNSSQACKYLAKVEATNGGKHSSLLQYSKSYHRKKFYGIMHATLSILMKLTL